MTNNTYFTLIIFSQHLLHYHHFHCIQAAHRGLEQFSPVLYIVDLLDSVRHNSVLWLEALTLTRSWPVNMHCREYHIIRVMNSLVFFRMVKITFCSWSLHVYVIHNNDTFTRDISMHVCISIEVSHSSVDKVIIYEDLSYL